MRHAVVLAGILAWSPCTFALNPALDVSQYAHTPWKIRDGFTKGAINAIAQTPDGYLWLGTEFGLLRFDGVRNVPWPPPDRQLPSNRIISLASARDGTLWIGTAKGLASWKGGNLTHYADFAGRFVSAILEDREGAVWVGESGIPTGRLCAIRKAKVQCVGEDGRFGPGSWVLYEDSKATLWASVANGLWRWKPGPPKLYPLPGTFGGIRGIAEGDDRALLIGTYNGIRRFIDGQFEAYPLPRPLGELRARMLLRDREGSVWIGTGGQGLVHVHQGRTDVFTQLDGLSGNDVGELFEDREGNIWAATVNGLDRFRNFAVPTLSVNQGLSNSVIASVLADRDGSLWFAEAGGLNRWSHGQVTVYRARAQNRQGTPGGAREIVVSGLPDRGLASLFQDDRGRIWVTTLFGAGYLENERFVSINGIPGGNLNAITGDTAGNIWIANQNLGLFRLSRENVIERIPWARFPRESPATALAADSLRGGLWVGFYHGGVAYFQNGQVRASYQAADGLGGGSVNNFQLDRDGTLWAATEGGLSRLKGGRVATLTGKNGLPCDGVHWVMEDNAGAFWLYTECGLLRVPRSELDAWAAVAEKDKNTTRVIQVTVFDSSDGVRIRAVAIRRTPTVARSADGKIWFPPADGVSVLDPRHLSLNSLPPPVHVEQIVADGRPYDANTRLPPLVRDLEIDYTALSLVAPERVKFRYRLEGHDRDWQDAGTRRQAFYNDLPPRNYRFRAIACNNSGVWNEVGASIDFSVAPAYYQTIWFLAACIGAALMVLAALYQLRLRYVKHQFNLRLEERVAERTRIARDFHDTLLQSFQGVLMKLSALSYRLGHSEIQEALGKTIEEGRQAIIEGRDAVQGLRSSTLVTNDLARAIGTLGEELTAGLAADQAGPKCPEFRVRVEGTTQDLAPLVRDDVHRIACEAVRNAFRHAQATRIEVEIHYDRRELRLRVVDNGKGIDQPVAGEGARPGHFGLPGMRERAKLVGGELALLSGRDSGTEVELTIPAALAYTKSPATAKPMSLGEGT